MLHFVASGFNASLLDFLTKQNAEQVKLFLGKRFYLMTSWTDFDKIVNLVLNQLSAEGRADISVQANRTCGVR